MNRKIITNLREDVKSFYDDNILFKTIQVQKRSGIYGKVKKEYIRKYPTRYKGIQINFSGYVNALCFDCDHEDVLLYRDFNLPEPTITTINQKNGRHHHIYFLETPVPQLIAKQKTIKYLADIYDSLTKQLGADVHYTNVMTKNFLNQKEFRVIGNLLKYRLDDFRDNIVVSRQKKINPNIEKTVFSRHIKLFDEIRYFGYSVAKDCRDEAELYNSIQSYAKRINKNFCEPIKIKYIVKSVFEFCWQNRENFNKAKWNWDGYTKLSKKEYKKRRSETDKIRERKKLIKKLKNRFTKLHKPNNFHKS